MVLAICGGLAGPLRGAALGDLLRQPLGRRRAAGEGPRDRPARRSRLDPGRRHRGGPGRLHRGADVEVLRHRSTRCSSMYVLVFAVLVVRPRGIGGLLDEVRAVSATSEQRPRRASAAAAAQPLSRPPALLPAPARSPATGRCTAGAGRSRAPRAAPRRPLQPAHPRRERVVTEKGRSGGSSSSTLTLADPAPRRATSSILTISSTFAIYASVNLMWMLVFGTAGILSLASLAITGIGAYTAGLAHDPPRPAVAAVVRRRRHRRPAGGRDHLDPGETHGRHVLRAADARHRRGLPRLRAAGATGSDAAVAGLALRRRRLHPRGHPLHGRRPAARLHRRLPPAARGARRRTGSSTGSASGCCCARRSRDDEAVASRSASTTSGRGSSSS